MAITPEEYLFFLQDGLKSEVLQDLMIAEAHIDRMRDLLGVGVTAIKTEIHAACDSDLVIDNKRLQELSELQEILCRQSAVLTPLLASIEAAANVFSSDLEIKEDTYKRMTELIASHPELLEDRAAANAVALGDNDASTQAKRFELNRLLRSEGDAA